MRLILLATMFMWTVIFSLIGCAHGEDSWDRETREYEKKQDSQNRFNCLSAYEYCPFIKVSCRTNYASCRFQYSIELAEYELLNNIDERKAKEVKK